MTFPLSDMPGLLMAQGDNGWGQLIYVIVLMVLAAAGSLFGKKREKDRQRRERPPAPRQVPRAEAPPQAQRPSAPRPTAPARRSPVRVTPPRARPPRPQRMQPQRRAVRPQDQWQQVEPQQRQAPSADRAVTLGRGVIEAAQGIAQHAEQAVARHTEQTVARRADRTASRLAEQERRRWEQRADESPGTAVPARRLIQKQLTGSDLRRAIVLAEILGPPVSEREG